MDIQLLLYSSVILIGAVLLLMKKTARWGGLLAGMGFVPFGYYLYRTNDAPLFMLGGLIIAAIAVFRFFRPYGGVAKQKQR